MRNKLLRIFKKNDTRKPLEEKDSCVNNVSIEEKYERCVLCGELTCIPISMPIVQRENYEIGIGQLCSKCAKRTREIC